MTSKTYLYTVAVWGSEFVDKFLSITLPSLLASGNLPLATRLSPSEFLIVTTEADIQTIRQNPLFLSLKEILPVSFSTFHPSKHHRYTSLSKAHRIAINNAVENQNVLIFLSPDWVIANGGISKAMKPIETGKRAVLTASLRVVEESFSPILAAYPRSEDGALSIEPRLLTELALNNLHPQVERYIWTSKRFTKSPHLCMWDSPNDDGFLIRGFHLHPLILDLSELKKHSQENTFKALSNSTIDGNFLGSLIGRRDDIFIINDSDILSIYSLTPRAYNEVEKQGRSDADCLRMMAYSSVVNSLHRHFFTKAIYMHTQDIDEKWKSLEEETGLLANTVLDLDLFDAYRIFQNLINVTLKRTILEVFPLGFINFMQKWLSSLRKSM